MSKSIISAFRERNNLPRIISVPWPMAKPAKDDKPEVKPELVFQIARFAEEEHTPANLKAINDLKARGLEYDETATKEEQHDYAIQMNYWFLYRLADIIRKHIKGWEHLPPEGVAKEEYSAQKCAELISEFDIISKVELSRSYLNVLEQLQKKSQENGAIPPDSSTP